MLRTSILATLDFSTAAVAAATATAAARASTVFGFVTTGSVMMVSKAIAS